VIDLGDITGNSWARLPVGNCGVSGSAYYTDQTLSWGRGEYKRILFSDEDIEKNMEHCLIVDTGESDKWSLLGHLGRSLQVRHYFVIACITIMIGAQFVS